MVTVVLRPHSRGAMTLLATANAFTKDPDAVNNSATASFTVQSGPPTITGIARQDGLLAFTFATDAGRNYQLESALEVTGPWQVEGLPVMGNGAAHTVSLGLGAEPQRFFRVRQD